MTFDFEYNRGFLTLKFARVEDRNVRFFQIPAKMDEAIRHLQNGLLNRAKLDEATQKQYSCVLQHCVIDFGDSLDPLLRDPDHPELPDHEHIDLAFLDGLGGTPEDSEDFLPQTIYVRKCMRKLFRLFAKDAAVMQMTGRTVDAVAPMDILIGSPAATETGTDDLSSAADVISRKKARKRHGIGTTASPAIIPLPGVVDETAHFTRLAGNDVEVTTMAEAFVAVRPAKTRTTLIGSVGVGKSVLFFLAALHRSRSKITICYRLMESSDKPVSAFVMFPCPHNKVNVLFTRSLSRGSLAEQDWPGLTGLDDFLGTTLGIRRSHYYAFVNGPRYNDTKTISTSHMTTFVRHVDARHLKVKKRREAVCGPWMGGLRRKHTPLSLIAAAQKPLPEHTIYVAGIYVTCSMP
jgi:hypothetical protein